MAGTEPVAHEGPQAGTVGLAFGSWRCLEMRLQVRLTQLLSRAVGECGGGVGRRAKHGSQLAWPTPLHDGLPQRDLRLFGKRFIRLHDQLSLDGMDVGVGASCLDVLWHLRDGFLLRPGDALGGNAAQRDEEVGPERLGGASATPDRSEDAFERLVDEVIGIAGAPVGVRQPAGGRLVPCVELRERRAVALARPAEEVGIRSGR